MAPLTSYTLTLQMPKPQLLICMKLSWMAQSSMSRLSFLAANFHGRRLHFVEVLALMIASRHAHLPRAAIEEDLLSPIMGFLGVEDIAHHHHPEEAHLQGDMEVAQPQEIVTSTLTGRAHFPARDHREHAHGHIPPDRGPGLLHVEVEITDTETVHRHQEEEGEEGVPATPAFLAIAIGAVAGVEVDMDAGEVSVPVLDTLVRAPMVAIETSF